MRDRPPHPTHEEPGSEVTLHLTSGAGAPYRARRAIGEALSDLVPTVIETAQLLTSELVTNAVRHGRGTIGLRVRRHSRRLSVEVSDEGGGTPTLRQPMPTGSAQPGGWGLHLVDQLATRWGVDPAGGRVWFELATG